MATELHIGINRTGRATSPALSKSMIEGTQEFPPTGPGDEREIARVREDYVKDADPIGSVPPPPKVKGRIRAARQAMMGEHPALLIDKLGARLAFERAGTRLWEALLSKYDADGSYDGGPERVTIERIANEEFDHFRMLSQVIEALGGDPTVVTPSADLQLNAGKGVLEVLVDPRTNLVQCLEAIVIAELADNESWQALAEIARQAGEKALVDLCERALEEEDEHLETVRSWLRAAQHREE